MMRDKKQDFDWIAAGEVIRNVSSNFYSPFEIIEFCDVEV